MNVNRILVQKIGIPTPKARKIQKMFKSLVNTDMHAQGNTGGVMRSKTGWVIYREVEYRPGPQKIKNRGSHWVLSGCWASRGAFKC